MSHNLFDIKFDGIDDLLRLSETQSKLLKTNITAAVVDTTLFGINRIANDCPVDTGMLRASLTGEFGDEAEVDLKKEKIGEAKALSTTKIDRLHMEGQIGTNVEYALHVEYGHIATGPKKLTDKQRRYLFAIGVLKSLNGKVVISDINRRINKRAGVGNRVKGKGFFRKNIPLIRNHFDRKMNEAIEATKEGRSIGGKVAVT